MYKEKITDKFKRFTKSSDFFDAFVDQSNFMTLKKGSEILHLNNYISVIPFLTKGLAKVYREDENGNEVLLYYIKPGESCIISITTCIKNQKSSVKAIVEEDCELFAISSDLFKKMLKEHHVLNDFVFDLFQEKYLELIDVIELLSFSKQEERLLKYLQKQAALKSTNELLITHKNIAEDLATSREVITRLLKNLQQRNLIILKKPYIQLL